MFDGGDLVKQPDSALADLRLRSFGFVFQQFNLIPTLTAVENVEAKLAPVAGTREQALELLAEAVSPSGPTTCPRTCPEASSSAWRSPVPCRSSLGW